DRRMQVYTARDNGHGTWRTETIMCVPSTSSPAREPLTATADEVLIGEIATLEPLSVAEIPEIARLVAEDPESSAWWGTNAGKIEGWLTEEATHPYRVVVDSQTAGVIEFSEENDPDYRYASIDIALLAPYVGRGIGPDALRTLLRHLFGTRGHHRATIDPMVDNARAIRAYAKAGFKPVGVMRRAERDCGGEWRDNLLMDILAAEFI
ncbi:MAG: GNAT family N-acetyltransferase, partial [Coriobacteriia bacterium]